MSSGNRGAAEIPLHLDRSADAPLPVQLAAALREAIDADTLRPGEGVPATRELARRLGVARGVVVAAYEQLAAEGYLSAGQGRGTTVNPALSTVSAHPTETAQPTETVRLAEPWPAAVPTPATGSEAEERGESSATATRSGPVDRGTLAPGAPLTDASERSGWRAAWRAAATRAESRAPYLGEPGLRDEIADHLRRMRGARRSAADVIVTAGAREGLGLLLTALGSTRGRQLVVGVEDPGYPSLRGVAARHGASIVALPVDLDGLRTELLPRGVLDAVIVTPSHQYPLGGSLPLSRRRELLQWARDTGVVIIEDDYDSELRHAGSPLPALAALDDPEHGVVVTLGTFSSTVTPALAAGFLVAPAGLRALIEPVRRDLGSPVSGVVQVALREYLASGELRRNIARMRRLYTARRDSLSDRLAGLPGVRLRPMSGGLHAVIELGDAEQERRIVAQCERAGLGAAPLGRYWQGRRSGAAGTGIVIGMGGPDADAFERAVERLRGILLES